jgi:GTP-binding protein
MSVPVVAIIGRPNVGKSSLFNWLAGKRIAIVEPTAGVTRDRVAALVPTDRGVIELTDTGGLGVQDVDGLTAQVEQQIAAALGQAQVIIFVVDGRAGVMPLDEDVAARLRGLDKPIIVAVNKCDYPDLDYQSAEFYKLGKYPQICVSAQQNRNKPQLLGLIAKHLPKAPAPTKLAEPALKLAIVGRRNTGKSTFINRLAREERVIVSEVAGTTRDSIDVRFERDGQAFIAIDTAGVRHKASLQNDIEFYSLARAQRSIRRADVVLLFLDVRMTISHVDKQLAGSILESCKPTIFVVNKWDLATPLTTGEFGDYVRKIFPSLDFVPIAFITAKEGKNVQAVLNLAQSLHKQASSRIPTGELNRVVRQALEQQAPPMRQNRRPKIFYATQVAANPPTIVLFTNGPELIDNTYERYLLKYFRDHLPFGDVPIQLYVRKKKREDTGEEAPQEEPAPQPRRRRSAPAKSEKSTKPPKRKRPTRGPELWNDV